MWLELTYEEVKVLMNEAKRLAIYLNEHKATKERREKGEDDRAWGGGRL